MEQHLRDIIRLSLGGSPEQMLERALRACIELSGASGGSILGEEGPRLQFLFSDVPDLIGVRVPFDSIAGATARRGVVIYTYAPSDERHFDGVDERISRVTRYLLSVPIPSIHESAGSGRPPRNSGVLQLLFSSDVFPDVSVNAGPIEMPIDEFREHPSFGQRLHDVFVILPNVAFAMEVVRLRQTSYQAIHELKNKFIAAVSWLDYLAGDVRAASPGLLDSGSAAEAFELARTSSVEGAELAKTYLTFTRLYEPHYEDTDVNALLREVAASAEAFARESGPQGLRVQQRLDPSIPNRRLDASKLKMAFFNLCKNAVEALAQSGTTGPTLSIESELAGRALRIRIGDNGPGMPPDIADNLFIPFKTKKEGGTGLGLTITKKIIDIHDGAIECATGPGGTVFTVTI